MAPLLSALFDDAGLFPPASLAWSDALAGNASSRAGSWSWMLGRFVCPVDRLVDVPEGVGVSVLVDGPASVPTPGSAGADRVEAIECAPGDVDTGALSAAAAAIGVEDVFLEVPARADAVAALAGTGVGAKVRCGGATVPSAVALADAIAAAAAEGVRCKATAGLHHPFRHRDEGSGELAHGFLNLLAAAAAAMAGADQATVLDALEDQRPGSFQLSGERFGWGSWTVTAAGARRLRTEILTSIGTCSFDEPVDDLRALGIVA